MVKWPLALFGHILGFAGLELRVFGEGGFFSSPSSQTTSGIWFHDSQR